MSESQARNTVVVVAGDVTIDWHLARSQGGRQARQRWDAAASGRIWCEPGGAALTAHVLEAATADREAKGLARVSIVRPWELGNFIHPGDRRFHHVYRVWSPHRYGEKPPLDREKPAWRVEQFVGLDRSAAPGAEAEQSSEPLPEGGPADLVVLYDGGLGFRDHPESWPAALMESRPGVWIVVSMSSPVAQGKLWQHLLDTWHSQAVIVLTADDLRLSEVQISLALSWERTAQDVIWELTHNPSVNGLSHCAHVIVSFGTAGALLRSRQAEGKTETCLFFDPQVMEGGWAQDYPGGMAGEATCLTAAVASELLRSPDAPNLGRAIQSGTAAMRRLHLEGYGERGVDPTLANLAFPRAVVAEELARWVDPLAAVRVQDPVRSILAEVPPGGRSPTAALGMRRQEAPPPGAPKVTPGMWTILEDQYADSLDRVAEQIVLQGFDAALDNVPMGRFGGLVTVDRREIEALRSVRALIEEYCQRPQKRPLSIAVFGPPGSGKSFGVEQVAKSARPGEIQVLGFNLSQFGSPTELLDALHQVRDAALTGKIPLVFWDEFDTALDGQRLGWLRYFLAPMQDGAFQEGQIVHPIGRCIFVFAGGTSVRMESFGGNFSEEEQRAVKLPDFVSRLKGFLDVLGPNRQVQSDVQGRADGDPYFIIRRAIILRSLFERTAPELIGVEGHRRLARIDRGVLRAFLRTRQYKHGVRSIESLIAMSRLAGERSFERSCLPSEAQLALHVEARDFLALVQQIELEGELLEKLSRAAHEVFSEGLEAKGFRLGPKTDEKRKTHASLRPYDDLPEEEKEQNRANVRDIPNKLASIGYVMLPARSNEPPLDFPGADLERLAAWEHERWMAAKHAGGWRHAPKTDKERKVHKALVPWEELPKAEKDKDRDLVRGMPRILARAGYGILRESPSPSDGV
ncbi:MAG TPA: RyR domain-containing protein [Anaerolineales bacterium]|nr:RyR domain-containing protein [Anaerolineales bacterium]